PAWHRASSAWRRRRSPARRGPARSATLATARAGSALRACLGQERRIVVPLCLLLRVGLRSLGFDALGVAPGLRAGRLDAWVLHGGLRGLLPRIRLVGRLRRRGGRRSVRAR